MGVQAELRQLRRYDSTNSVSTAGSRIIWTWCATSTGVCSVGNYDRATQRHGTTTLVQTGARSIVGDDSNMFFIDNYALERLAY